jgi:hypothetical protein
MRANEERDDDGDRLLDLEALAQYSSLSVRTLRRWLVDPAHPLPHYQVQPAGKDRGRTVVSKRAFDAWMEQFRRGGTPPPRDQPKDPSDPSYLLRAFRK